MGKAIIGVVILLLCCRFSFSQQKETSGVIRTDTLTAEQKAHDTLPVFKADTVGKKVFNPRTAALRSAIFPGLGQIYNKKYWKVPIVYGAIGTAVGIFFFNLKEFKDVSFAYKVLVNKDSANFKKVSAHLLPLVEGNASYSLRNYRNQKRSAIDYSILGIALVWALNVVDATVDAHLKGFDVSSDLSMKIHPGYNPGTRITSFGLAFDLHKGKAKVLPAL